MADDALSQSQIVKRNRIYEGWVWLRQNLLPVAIIFIAGALGGHFEAYIGYGYRLGQVELALKSLPDQAARDAAAAWKQKIDDHDADHEKRISRIEDNLNLDLNEKVRKAKEAARTKR
jgi:hypothetical protein